MIGQCALATITERGKEVEKPTLTPLDGDESGFLMRHVDKLRAFAESPTAGRGRFRRAATEGQLAEAVTADEKTFLALATGMVHELAEAMKATRNAKDCVVAVFTHGVSTVDTCTLLKLDADREGAIRRRRGGVLRLSVYKDMLPSPGEFQKGFSWPDPRSDSSVIVRDHNGESAFYFLNAFGIDGSPSPSRTELAVVQAIVASVPEKQRAPALAAADRGGTGEEVVAAIRAVAPSFEHSAPELGADGALPGRLRPARAGERRMKYEADGFTLLVPIDRTGEVSTVRDGDGYATTVRTAEPLTPLADSDERLVPRVT